MRGKKEEGPRAEHSSCQVLRSRPRTPEKTASISAAGGGGEGLIGCSKRWAERSEGFKEEADIETVKKNCIPCLGQQEPPKLVAKRLKRAVCL